MGRNNYITKAESQLKYELVYKKIAFKEDMLCHLVTKSNSVSQDFRLNGCITEKEIMYFSYKYKKITKFLLQITKKIENDIFRKGYNKNILNILSISIF